MADDGSIYVGFDGLVLPCVMAAVPVGRPRVHWGPRGPVTLERLPLGDLRRETLAAVWRRQAARRARRGKRGEGPIPGRCRDCFKTGVCRLRAGPPPMPGGILPGGV